MGHGGRGLGDAVGPRRPAGTPVRLTGRAPLPLVSPAPFPPHPQLPPGCGDLARPHLARSRPSGSQGAQFGRGPGEPCLPARAARAATSAASDLLGTAGGRGAAGPLARLSGRVELPGVRLSPAVMCVCLSPGSYTLSQVFHCSCNVLSCHLCPLPCFFPLFPSCSSLGREKASGLSSAQPSVPKRKLGLGVITVHRVVETDGCDQP